MKYKQCKKAKPNEIAIKTDYTRLCIHVRKDMKERVAIAAEEEGVSISAFMRGLFIAYEEFQKRNK